MKYDYDVVIVGAGSAGMIAAEVAAKIGVRAALAERRRVGGDCLWTGCVPSKALLASARAAHVVRHADRYGLPTTDLHPDTADVWRRIREIQAEIAATDDNPDRYAALGVDLLWGNAEFMGDHRLRVSERVITTKYALVCTGSRPVAPPIEGLNETGYLDSENLFELERAPRSLIIVGAGPIGVEMAQAMNRLGVKTVLLERLGRILESDEPALSDILLRKLLAEGVDVSLNVELTRVERDGEGKVIHGRVGKSTRAWTVEEILVAAGREPNIESLGLDNVGVKTGPRGIAVDTKMRSSAKWVYAAGDCAGRFIFTHSAGAEAAIALRNMFFPGWARAAAVVPWTTFTDPELAHVGMTSDKALSKLGPGRTRVWRWSLEHSDRARTDGSAEGQLIVVTDSKFKILGAHILSPSAGEMIGQFTLAISRGLRLTPEFANLIQVYPTFSTSVTQLAAEATYTQLRRPFLRTLRWLNERIIGR